MNYLSRPIFQFTVNWADPVNRSFPYDLREVSLGFGAEYFTGRQTQVAQGAQFMVDLTTDAAIVEFDAFTADRLGPAKSFWLPVPMEALEIVAGVSATQFDITDQNLRDTWADHPDVHLYFTAGGQTPQAAQIAAVADLGGGIERVTLTTALAVPVNSSWSAARLHCVRLADDVERAWLPREGWQRRSLRVIELPLEYAEPVTASPVIYLYHFWAAAPIDYHWYFTSFASNVLSAGNEYVAAPINHGRLRQSVRFEAESLEIYAGYSADHPLALFLPVPTGRPINVEVFETTFDDPDTVTRLFTGQVRRVPDSGERLTAHCDSFASLLKQRIPPLLAKPDCDYQVYDSRTCKAPQVKFQTSGHITAIDNTAQPPTMTISLRFPNATRTAASYFAQGWIETGMRLSFEVRTIFNSTWDAGASRLTVVLNAPLLKAVVGQEVQIIPGCDGTAGACLAKFRNYENFPGFIGMPRNNLSLVAIDNKVSAGDKK
jgi:uncharacterized phage protein (TIGR02218 family)